jgi:peptide/nickel transport system substrate-binding protein
MKRYFFCALVIILLGGLIFSGCTKTSTATTTTQIPTATSAAASTTSTPTTTGPQTGGILRFIEKPQVQNLGYPGKATGPSDMTYIRPCCEFLINFAADNSGEMVPELAESWEWSSDYLHITMKLKQGINFQDGTPFNAEAVKFNLELQGGGARGELKLLKSVDVIDNYTVRLNLSGFDSTFLGGLMAPCGWMVSPTGIKTMGDAALLHPIGTGPFKFDSYQTDVSLKYTKWEGYWQKGKPYLDGIEFVFIKDPVTQLSSFKAGEAQVIDVVAAKDSGELIATNKYDYEKYPGQLFGLAGDSAHPTSHYANIKVRQAVAYALDNAAIAKAVGFGQYDSTNQFAVNGSPIYNTAIKGYPYNVDKAKQLLAEANYPGGFDTTLIYNSADAVQGALMAIVQSQLAEVGIKAKLDAADAARFNTLSSGGWTDALVFFWVPAKRGAGNVIFKSFMSQYSFIYTPKSILIPEAFATLEDTLQIERDNAKAVAEAKELNRIAVDDYCMAIPIMAPITFRFNTRNVKDLDLFVYDIGGWRPENAWLSK